MTCVSKKIILKKINVSILNYDICEILITHGYIDNFYIEYYNLLDNYDIESIALLIKNKASCIVEHFNMCLNQKNIGVVEKLLQLKIDANCCYLQTFIKLIKTSSFEMVGLLCEYGYNINNYPEYEFCAMINDYIFLNSIANTYNILLRINCLLKNRYTEISKSSFEILLKTNDTVILEMIIQNDIPLFKCPYICYFRADHYKNFNFTYVLDKNGYMELVSDHRIKRTVLIALTTCSRNNQLNFNMSAIILRYCSYFYNISANDMIEDYVFRKVFKLKVL